MLPSRETFGIGNTEWKWYLAIPHDVVFHKPGSCERSVYFLPVLIELFAGQIRPAFGEEGDACDGLCRHLLFVTQRCLSRGNRLRLRELRKCSEKAMESKHAN